MTCNDKSYQPLPVGMPLLTVVAAVLVDRESKVLLAQRPQGKKMAGLWEFPGGKLEMGETPETAIVRELKEELGIDTSENCLAPLTFVSHRYDDFHLFMPVFVCRQWKGFLTPQEGQNFIWVTARQLRDYPMPSADLPIIPVLQDLL
jgi:8-oxo-dGTP diphosphatase